MKNILLSIYLIALSISAQTFKRTELPTTFNVPWEIIYGPDGYLWLTDSGGRISRVNPSNGNRTVVYNAPDYFDGSRKEQKHLCFKPKIGSGTLGMALHPDFTNPATSYIYYVYSYNSTADTANPATRFKIVRLKWDASRGKVTENKDLVLGLPTGYDHLGGRLMAIKRNGTPYLFFTVGDNGISETNSPTCYSDQSTNPNNFAQDPNYKNGKVHRFNMDGSIPSDNPLPGNSFYTRGHRNPQGLIYNPNLDILYDIEHGDRSDDEINILEKGMNYGWKWVRGYHGDNNFPGEDSFIESYTPYPGIANDALKPPFYAWCATEQSKDTEFLNWCTVAPSDGIYYGSAGIPQWNNSLLVVTLKDGSVTDHQLYQFKLNPDGSLVASTPSNLNPSKYFAEDQLQNGRLRDIAVSPDGKKIFLINNFGANRDKITIYTYEELTSLANIPSCPDISLLPNPASSIVAVSSPEEVSAAIVYNMLGEEVMQVNGPVENINVTNLESGFYLVKLTTKSGAVTLRKFSRA